MPIFKLVPRKSGAGRDRLRLLRPYRQFIARLKRAKTKLGQVTLRRGERLSRVRSFLREAARKAGVSARLSRDGKAITVTLRARVGRRRGRKRARKASGGARAEAMSARKRARRRGAKRVTPAAGRSAAVQPKRKASRATKPKTEAQAS